MTMRVVIAGTLRSYGHNINRHVFANFLERYGVEVEDDIPTDAEPGDVLVIANPESVERGVAKVRKAQEKGLEITDIEGLIKRPGFRDPKIVRDLWAMHFIHTQRPRKRHIEAASKTRLAARSKVKVAKRRGRPPKNAKPVN